MTEDKPVGSAWQNRNFITFMVGQFVSNTGHSIAATVIIWLLMDITGSSSTASFSYIVSYLPSLIFTPFAGVLLDRFPKRLLMLIIDVLRGCLAVFMAFTMLQGLPPLGLVMLYFFVRSIGEALYAPASEAIIPNLVPREQLVQANGIKQTAAMGGGIIGPVLGALAVSRFGYGGAFFADALTFVVSVVSLLIIRVQEGLATVEHAKLNLSSYFGELKEALLYIRTKAVIMQLMFTFSVINFGGAAMNVMMPFYITERLANSSVDTYAQFMSAYSVGGMIIAVSFSLFKEMRYKGKLVIVPLIVFTLCQVAIGFSTSLYLTMLFSFIRSVAIISNMSSSAIYQSEVEPGIRGRVFSFRYMLSTALAPVGVAAAGVAGSVMPAWMVISVFGAIGLVASLGGVFFGQLWRQD